MHVDVGDHLVGSLPVILYKSDPVGFHGRDHGFGDLESHLKQFGYVRLLHVPDGLSMLLGADESVSLREGIDVQETNVLLILVNNTRGGFPRDYAAEDALVRASGRRTERE